ncbi:MAG: hypothetical protein H8K05_14405 [Nitrospira sp.]|nr:hypothetical protein [Nitrospira sp.]
MFSAWDFNSWIASVGVLLVIISFLAGLGALVNALMAWIWEDEKKATTTAHTREPQKEDPTRKVA